jgi:DNA-binding CsgD family transcriptional regulator
VFAVDVRRATRYDESQNACSDSPMDTNALQLVIVIGFVLFIVFLLNVAWRGEPDESEPNTASFRLVGSNQQTLEHRKELWARLTLRERAVALLASEGKSNEEIARELGISRRTVEKHLENAYAKLHIRSRGALLMLRPDHSFEREMDSPEEQDPTSRT